MCYLFLLSGFDILKMILQGRCERLDMTSLSVKHVECLGWNMVGLNAKTLRMLISNLLVE